MVFERFWFTSALRIAALTATLFVMSWLVLQTQFYATAAVVASLAAYQVYALFRHVNHTNAELARFFRSIRYEDFSQTFGAVPRGASFEELSLAFADVMERFKRTRAEKEEHFRYLQTVIEHIGVGLLAFRADGDVELFNHAAKRLLGIPHLKNIRQLENLSLDFVRAMLNMKAGDRTLVKVTAHDELLQIAVSATEFRIREENFTLVSLQNIHGELEEKELEAWQNLIRVLTHEIMNSVTPISSLASTACGLMDAVPSGPETPGSEKTQDIRGALRTIEKRSRGLLHFVETYRNLTRIPKPKFEIVPVRDVLDDVNLLLQPRLAAQGIVLTSHIEPASLELTADPELVQQVLINLLLNAIEALGSQENGAISISARLDDRGHVIVQVADNGPGIAETALERIFIPFFTTKQSGSGIGLSLSKEIMRLHHGTIQVRSKPGVETVFTLRF